MGNLVTNLPFLRNMQGHHSPVPFLITQEMFGGMEVEVAGGEISSLIGKPVADLHTHPVPEIYLLLSPEPGGARIQIEANHELHIIEAPAAFFVPAMTPHRFVTLEAIKGSYCLGILLIGRTSEVL